MDYVNMKELSNMYNISYNIKTLKHNIYTKKNTNWSLLNDHNKMDKFKIKTVNTTFNKTFWTTLGWSGITPVVGDIFESNHIEHVSGSTFKIKTVDTTFDTTFWTTLGWLPDDPALQSDPVVEDIFESNHIEFYDLSSKLGEIQINPGTNNFEFDYDIRLKDFLQFDKKIKIPG